jgi:hypothetical protein
VWLRLMAMRRVTTIGGLDPRDLAGDLALDRGE